LAKTLSVALALLLWQILSIAVADKLLLVSPIDVIKRLSEMIFEKEFISASLFTFKRIALGFLSGVVVGTALALTAGRFKFVETLLWPYMITVKSVPVASFVVIALLWINGANLSFLISFLMVLPIIYTNILEGVHSVDEKMLEMAEVFKMPFSRRLRFIWLPCVKPFLLSGSRIALGLAWKSGVAAELIGYPEGSVGEVLYYSKLFMNTADLFAWTVVIVLLSVLFERLVLSLLKCLLKGVESL
jgi:NitT/TauT family transport system permease protein